MLSFSQDNGSGGEGGVAVATGLLQSPCPAAGAPSTARSSTGQEHDQPHIITFTRALIFVNLSTDLFNCCVFVMSVLVRFLISARALLSDPGADGGAAQAEGAAVQD